MTERLKRFLSPDCGPLGQFVKYGAIGVLATGVQVAVFYLLAATVLRCLKEGDWAVRLAGMPAADVSDAVRGVRFALATAVGFCCSNVLCWALNRALVFKAGKFAWYKEFALFIGVSGLAMALATGLSWLLIHACSMMTTVAVVLEVLVSFLFNYFFRKFVIFKG